MHKTYRCSKCGSLRAPEYWILRTAQVLKIAVADVAPMENQPLYCPVCGEASLSTEIETIITNILPEKAS